MNTTMLKVKSIVMRKGWTVVRLCRIQHDTKVLYFLNGYASTRDALNAKYKELKAREYEIVTKDYEQDKDVYMKRLAAKKFMYADYCDDYKRWQYETEVNKQLSNIIMDVYNL